MIAAIGGRLRTFMNQVPRFCIAPPIRISAQKEEKMEYIKLPHSIKSKDENGKILAEITFPENEPGIFTIDHTYVSETLAGQGVAGKLVQMAVDQIREQGGEIRATCPYASGWLKKKGII